MKPKDPRTFLWSNIALHLKMESPSITDVSTKVDLPHTSVQRIRAGKTAIRMDTLMELAEGLGVEVWELLVPPGPRAEPKVEQQDLESALKAVALALQTVDPADRAHLLEALAKYSGDPAKKSAALNYVLQGLGGEPTPKGNYKLAGSGR